MGRQIVIASGFVKKPRGNRSNPEFLANSKVFCPLFCGNFLQKQSYKFAGRGCPRANLDLLSQIFSFGSKRFASFSTLFLLSAFLVATFKAAALNLNALRA